MAGFSDYTEAKLLDHITGKTSFTMPSVWVGLYTAAPSDAGGGTECTGGSYARKSTAGSDWTAAAAGSTSNAAVITFVTATAPGWGTATHFALFDSASAGNMLGWAALTTSKAIGTGDVASFPIGNLVLTLD